MSENLSLQQRVESVVYNQLYFVYSSVNRYRKQQCPLHYQINSLSPQRNEYPPNLQNVLQWSFLGHWVRAWVFFSRAWSIFRLNSQSRFCTSQVGWLYLGPSLLPKQPKYSRMLEPFLEKNYQIAQSNVSSAAAHAPKK